MRGNDMMSSASAGEGSQSQSQSQSQPFNHDLPNPGHPLHLSQICLLRSRLVRPPSLPRAFPTPSASNLCSHPPPAQSNASPRPSPLALPSPAPPISRAQSPHCLGSAFPALALFALPTVHLHPSLLRTPPKLLCVPRFLTFCSTLHLHRRPTSLAAMPSSLYVPVLVAGMLITVRTAHFAPPYALSDVSQGLE